MVLRDPLKRVIFVNWYFGSLLCLRICVYIFASTYLYIHSALPNLFANQLLTVT